MPQEVKIRYSVDAANVPKDCQAASYLKLRLDHASSIFSVLSRSSRDPHVRNLADLGLSILTSGVEDLGIAFAFDAAPPRLEVVR